jgi:dTDP-4-amino-4,6-dideoxygalactose transaminase
LINVFGSCVGIEELSEIKTSIDNQWLGLGKKVETFECMMASKTGLNDFVCVDNCSNGLYMALKILDLPEGSEVVLPAVTWISCVNAVMVAGLKPVFADVDYDTVNVTTKTISEALTRKTKAIMVVHYAGLPAITGFDIPIIADCAHSVDSYIDWEDEERHIARFYDISVFSFDSMKNIACGELGGITSPNKEYTDRARVLRYCGIEKSGLQASTDKKRWWEYECVTPFIKMLPNDISASIAIAQFKKLEILQLKRRLIWEKYSQELKDVSWLLIPPEIPDFVKHSYFSYYIRVLNGRRNDLAKYLLDNGIYTTVRYHPLHLMKCFKSKKELPIAERLNDELLNIPLHPNLTERDVDYIIEKIKSFS